jgi:hypothetical protein
LKDAQLVRNSTVAGFLVLAKTFFCSRYKKKDNREKMSTTQFAPTSVKVGLRIRPLLPKEKNQVRKNFL